MKLTQDVPLVKWKETSWVSFFFLFFLNIIIKYEGAEANSVWLDEAFSYFKAINSPQAILFNSSNDLGNPPFYYIILHYWGELFGYDSIGLRSLSLIASSLTASVLYVTGTQLFNKRAGWIAALLFTFSTQHVFYAQEIRSYAILTFLLSISTLYFIRFVYSTSFSVLMIIGMAVLNALLMYLNYAAMFFPLAELFVVLFLRNRKGLIQAFSLSSFLSILLYIPQILYLVYTYNNSDYSNSWWVETPKMDHFFHFWKFYWGFLWIPALFLLFFGIIIISVKRFLPIYQVRHFRILIFLFAATLVLNFVFSQFVISLFLPRYLICFTVFLCLLFGGLASVFWDRWWMSTLTIMMLVVGLYQTDFSPSNGEEWKEATAYYLEQAYVKEKPVYIIPDAGQYPIFYYLLTKDENLNLVLNQELEDDYYSGNSFSDFENLPLREIVVISSSNYLSQEERVRFWNLFQESYSVEDYASFGSIDYFHLKPL